jgi:formate/nitrite transporter FocA (FNT family)
MKNISYVMAVMLFVVAVICVLAIYFYLGFEHIISNFGNSIYILDMVGNFDCCSSICWNNEMIEKKQP